MPKYFQAQTWKVQQMHLDPKKRSGLEMEFGSHPHMQGPRSGHLDGSRDREEVQGPHPGHSPQLQIRKTRKTQQERGRRRFQEVGSMQMTTKKKK